MLTDKVTVRGHEGREIRVPYRCPFFSFMEYDKDSSILGCAVALLELNNNCRNVNGWPGWAVLSNAEIRTGTGEWSTEHLRRRVIFVMYNWELIESQNQSWCESVSQDLCRVYKTDSVDKALRSAQDDMITMRRRLMAGKSTSMTKNIVADFFCSAYDRLRYPSIDELLSEANTRLNQQGWHTEDDGSGDGYVAELTKTGVRVYPKFDDSLHSVIEVSQICGNDGKVIEPGNWVSEPSHISTDLAASRGSVVSVRPVESDE